MKENLIWLECRFELHLWLSHQRIIYYATYQKAVSTANTQSLVFIRIKQDKYTKK